MAARRFELVIFDCDGVLVDSEPIINHAHAHVLTACGYPITEGDLVGRFCGMSDADMLAIIEHEWGRALPLSYPERVGTIIENEFRQSLVAIAGVTETLSSLRLPVCVASSSTVAQIRRKLELTGLRHHFGENLFSATMVERGKPAPDLFLYAAEQLAAAPDRSLVIEDSPAGIDAALAAGMTAVGFCGGSHCGPEHGARLQEHRAALVMHDMRELANSRQSQPDDTPNLRARPEPIDAGVRRVPLERVPGTPDRRRLLQRPLSFSAFGQAASTRSTHNRDRSRR